MDTHTHSQVAEEIWSGCLTSAENRLLADLPPITVTPLRCFRAATLEVNVGSATLTRV